MKTTLKYHVSNTVNLDLLENMSLKEIDEFTSTRYDDMKELMESEEFLDPIYKFKNRFISYIRKVRSNNPDYQKVFISMIDDNGIEYQLPVRYKKEKKICDEKSLKNRVIKVLKEDDSCHAIYDVITKFDFLLKTDYNRINNSYISSSRKISTYVKDGMGTSTYVEEGRKGTLKSIENVFSKESRNSYNYLRIIDSMIYNKYSKKKTTNNIKVAGNFSTYKDPSVKKIKTTGFSALELEFNQPEVNFIGGNDFGFEEERDLEDDEDVHFGR